MSAGAIQTLLKSQRVATGRNVLLTGSHPLLLTVADQLLVAGVAVAAVVFTQQLGDAWKLLRNPATALRGAPLLLQAAGSLARLRRAGVRMLFGHRVVAALGEGELNAVRILTPSGAHTELACDSLGVCYGFLASTELARQAGARASWHNGHGWVVATDELLRTSVPGISVAGEQIGISGAVAAALSGEIAGIAIAADRRGLAPETLLTRTSRQRRRLARLRRFAALLADLSAPPAELLSQLADPSTVLCRCEDVTVGALTDALTSQPVASASTAKLLTRVGMGACQGRMCETSVRRLIAQHRACPIDAVPGYVVRAPVKPVPIALLAGAQTLLSAPRGDP